MAYQSCPEHGGPIKLCPYAHLPDPEPVPEPVESVSAAHPMRPWRWDAVTFKATQALPDDKYDRALIGLMMMHQNSFAQTRLVDPDGFYKQVAAIKPPKARGFFDEVKHWIFG